MPSPHQPDVSVVLPTWNGAKYLSQSIESVLHQEGVTKELIVVDDASYDYTPGICARYVEEYPDIIRYFRNETQQKLPTCLNIGFSRANGKAWTWTSDDNYYRNNALNTMYKALLSTKSDVVYAGVTDINENDRVLGINPTVHRDPGMLTRQNAVHACFLFEPRVYHQLGGYDPSLFGGEDWDFWLRAYLHGSRFHYIDKQLYCYRVHAHSVTQMNRPECLRAWSRIIWKNRLYRKYPNALAMWLKATLA